MACLTRNLAGYPAALVMALWIWRDRFGSPRAAAEIAPRGMAALGGQVAPPAATPPLRVIVRDPALAPSAANDCTPALAATCRACGAPLDRIFLDLGIQPLAESFASASAYDNGEPAWPLRLAKCASCHLVQTFETHAPHTNGGRSLPREQLIATFDVAAITNAFGVRPTCQVVEVASGDGTLLQHFMAHGFAPVGIEADHAAADVAMARGVPTRVCHFSVFSAHKIVKDGHAADLLIARDLISRTLDPARFANSSRTILKRDGILIFKFPHLLPMIERTGFEAICHERPSYFSLLAIEQLFTICGLRLLHATPAARPGWLRVVACRSESGHAPTGTTAPIIRREMVAGLDRIEAFE